MKKFTTTLDESNKSGFETFVKIELENGLVLEGNFQVKDYGLSYAKETSNKLVESAIKSVEILKVEPITEKVELENNTTETEENDNNE